MEIKTRWAQDRSGNVLPFAQVALYYQGTDDLVSGLEDKDGSPLENPFQADVNGKAVFAAPDGQYDIEFNAGPRESRASIQFLDVSGALQVVENIDTLRSITGNNGRDYMLVKFHTSEGDGGGGEFYLVDGESPGTYVDNGGTIIVPTGGDGSAAWLRIIPDRVLVGQLTPTATPGARDTILIARDIQGLSDRHGVRDESVLSNITDYGGYGTFDAVVTFTGDNFFDHQYSFQDRFRWVGETGMGTAGGYLSRPFLDGGTVQRRYAVHIEDYQGTAEVLVQYGIHVAPMSKGGVNYSFASEGADARFLNGGKASFGFPLVAAGAGEGLVYGGYSTESATQIGINSRGGANQAAIVSYSALRAAPGMTASGSAYTVPDLFGIDIADGGKGSNASADRFTGVNIRGLSNAASNRGIASLVGAGTNNWALFLHGAAQNYIGGNVGIGPHAETQRPNSRLVIDSGNSTTPQIRLRAGTLTTTPINGAIEYDGTDLWFTSAGVRKKFAFV